MQDFEQAWLAKFSKYLDESVGPDLRERVMEGSAELSAQSSRQEVIAWSKQAMERLDAWVDADKRKKVMLGCACHYPQADLQDIRRKYAETGDIDLALEMLQAQFEAFLRGGLKLDEALIAEIVKSGWGAAGVRQGNTIIATKIPKSNYLVEYMRETDPVKKRQLYCHCPRIRDVLKTGETLSPTYCYCGAGFYQGIWEEILQQPVELAVLASLLKGDAVCRFAIRLPL